MIAGDRGVVIQVKARDREPADETRYLRRVPVEMTNGRGRTLTVDGGIVQWSAVVVVEHPGVPEGITPSVEQQPNPSLVLLRREEDRATCSGNATLRGRYFRPSKSSPRAKSEVDFRPRSVAMQA